MSPADRRPSRVTPSKKQLAEGSGTTRKGRVPQAEGPPKGSRSKAGRAATPAAGGKGAAKAPGKGDGGDAGKGTPEKAEVVGTGAGRPAKPVHEDGRRYGGGALLLVFLGAQLLASIAYGLVIPNSQYDPDAVTGMGGSVGSAVAQYAAGQPIVIPPPVPLWLSTLLQLPLWGALIAGPLWFAAKRGRGIVEDLGLRMKAVDVPVGLAIGVACQLLLVPALYWLVFKAIGVQDVSAQARALTDRATDPLSVLLVFVIVGIGAPIAEEIYFRGMALPIFRRKLSPMWAVLASAAFFAATHLQPLQFPALLLFGVVLGMLTVRAGRLGPAIWAHVGFNVVAAASLVWNIGFF